MSQEGGCILFNDYIPLLLSASSFSDLTKIINKHQDDPYFVFCNDAVRNYNKAIIPALCQFNGLQSFIEAFSLDTGNRPHLSKADQIKDVYLYASSNYPGNMTDDLSDPKCKYSPYHSHIVENKDKVGFRIESDADGYIKEIRMDYSVPEMPYIVSTGLSYSDEWKKWRVMVSMFTYGLVKDSVWRKTGMLGLSLDESPKLTLVKWGA